jgi:glycosyltransferase involved in cell wall biosynthesis
MEKETLQKTKVLNLSSASFSSSSQKNISSQEKINLVIATDNFLPRRDGVVSFLLEIIPSLKEQFNLTIICPDASDIAMRPEIPGVTFVFIPLSRRSAGDFNFAKNSPRTIYSTIKKSDIVFSQTLGPIGATAVFLSQRLHKKNVSFIHSIDWELASKALKKTFLKWLIRGFAKTLAKFLYKRATHLIIPSESISEILLWKKINTPRTIIHLGVDTKKFKPLNDQRLRNKQRELIGLDLEDVAIVYHGRLAREKDIPTLLRAFSLVQKKFYSAKLVIIGSGISEITTRLQNKKNIIHIPSTSHPEKYLPLCDIYCLPSLTETTSLGTLEAMSCQLPIISTPVGFVKDYISQGKTGYLFSQGNSQELARKILYLISNPSKAQTIGANARAYVQKNFTWEKTTFSLVSFFKELGQTSWSPKDKRKAISKKHKLKRELRKKAKQKAKTN